MAQIVCIYHLPHVAFPARVPLPSHCGGALRGVLAIHDCADVAFHCDGSLAATVGLDTHARVWDLRVGRNILTFSGHVKQTLAASFSPNGFHLATGAGDHMCKVWDLRMKKEVYTILAHSKLISQVRRRRL